MLKKASILGLSLLLVFYPTAGLAAELEDQQQMDDQNEIESEVDTENNIQADNQEPSADPVNEEVDAETSGSELNEVQVETDETANEQEETTEEENTTENETSNINNEDQEATVETNINEETNANTSNNESEGSQDQDSQQLDEGEETQQLDEEENQELENQQLDEDLDLTKVYGAINQRSGTTIEYDYNKGYYTLDLQAGLNNMSRNQVLTDKWIAFALPNGVYLADQDLPAGVVQLDVNGKNGIAIKIPDVGEFPDSKFVYPTLPLVGEPNDNDPVLNLYLYNVDVDQLTYENIGQIKETRNIDFSPMEGTPELEVNASFTGQASFDQDKGYYVLDLTVNATNHSNSNITSIYGAFTLPEGVEIIDTDDPLDGIELLRLNDDSVAVAVKLPELDPEEDGEVTYQIPLLGKATENVNTFAIHAYTINGSYHEVGQLNGSVNIDLSEMDQTWEFEAEGQIVGDYPGLDAGQLGLRFAFSTDNLTWNSIDRVTVEFLVPNTITIFEPDSYENAEIPDSLKDFLESDMTNSTNLDLTWNGNTATIDLDTVDAVSGFQGWFTAFGETDAALSDLEGLNVIVTLFQDGEEIAKELQVPFEIVSYKGDPVDPNENDDAGQDEMPKDKNEGPNGDTNKDSPSNDQDQLEISPVNNNDDDSNDQESNEKEQTSNEVNNNNGSSSTTSSTKGAELPNTATSMYSILLVGTVLTAAGATLLFIRNRRAMNE